MKKVFFIIVVSIILSNSLTYAITVDDTSIIETLNDGEVYVNDEIRTDISNIQDVGNGYLVDKQDENGNTVRYFTEDFENFREVNVFDDYGNLQLYYGQASRAGHMDEIKWADGVYMARSNVYDNYGKSGRVVDKEGYLYILDVDFQLLERVKFDWYVREMSYIGGVYYIRIWNKPYLKTTKWGFTSDDIVDKVYSSTDLVNWEERLDLEHVPISNGNKTITMKNDNIYIFENDKIVKRVVYEDVKIVESTDPYSDTEAQNVLNIVGEYFYVVNNNEVHGDVWLSKDGIYMTEFVLGSVELWNEFSSLYNNIQKSYVKKSNIDKYLQVGDIYVELDNTIFGFAQPPVMEDDRTLVPMRFLFEQMGAEVDWDDSTQTATATVPVSTEQQIATFSFETENSVTFSIDNLNATVNGELETMDVPARLINDQTFVPLRFLSENLGYNVEWDENTNTAIITTE